MQLVVLTEDFYPKTSGGAHIRWRFCQLAAKRGHDVTVFTPHEPGLAKSEAVDGVKIRRPVRVKPKGKPVYSPIAVVTRIAASVLLFAYLYYWLRNRNVDGLHSASHLTHWIGKILSVLYDLPLVSFIGYTPSTDPDPSFTPKLLFERANFRLFLGEIVFCQTPIVKEIVEARTDAKVAVVHGILNRDRIITTMSEANPAQKRTDLGIHEDATLLVYVGRLVPVKNPVGAIEVLSELPPEYALVVIGDGDELEAVEEAVCEHGVKNRVKICGSLSHDDTLITIAAADALVLPSHIESYPTVIFEALSLNTVAFATPVGILSTLNHSRLHIGLLDELSEIINKTIINTSNGLDSDTLERFSMERYTNEILTAFEKLRCHDASRSVSENKDQ